MCGLMLAVGHPIGAVARGLEAMEYRGLDGMQGLASMKKTVLGHVRLAIQDLETSNQPLRTEDSLVGFVGEVFNVPAAWRELDYVAHLLREEGPEGFHRVDGFWSVARVFENGSAQVFTDHLGIKPVYYWPEERLVCSELDPMFKVAPRPGFDPVYLSNCIKFGYDYSGRTPYRGIFQLAPGHVLRITPGGEMSTSRYWDWGRVPVPRTGLMELLERATMRRLAGSREVGLLLSGGLDSSIVHALLERNQVKVRTLSIENGESEFLPPGTKILPAASASQAEALEAMQAPLDLGSMVPQFALGKALAAEGIHVCLTGDGADELFGGYSRSQAYDSQASDVFCELPYYHLPRLDRVMMRHTIEVRTPFLAPEVVAFALRLPYADRIAKSCLKEAFRDLLPEAVINRPKWPLKTWEVASGGLPYRANLVKEFTCAVQSF